jgi:hypothetical protein
MKPPISLDLCSALSRIEVSFDRWITLAAAWPLRSDPRYAPALSGSRVHLDLIVEYGLVPMGLISGLVSFSTARCCQPDTVLNGFTACSHCGLACHGTGAREK